MNKTLNYEENIWGDENPRKKHYKEPKKIEDTFAVKWAKEHTFETPKGKDYCIPMEYTCTRNYNKLIRTMTNERWRDFLLDYRKGACETWLTGTISLDTYKYESFLKRVLKDVNLLQFGNRKDKTAMLKWPEKRLRNAEAKDNGFIFYLGKNKEPINFNLNKESRYVPLHVPEKDFNAWKISLFASMYNKIIWPQMEDYEKDGLKISKATRYLRHKRKLNEDEKEEKEDGYCFCMKCCKKSRFLKERDEMWF